MFHHHFGRLRLTDKGTEHARFLRARRCSSRFWALCIHTLEMSATLAIGIICGVFSTLQQLAIEWSITCILAVKKKPLSPLPSPLSDCGDNVRFPSNCPSVFPRTVVQGYGMAYTQASRAAVTS